MAPGTKNLGQMSCLLTRQAWAAFVFTLPAYIWQQSRLPVSSCRLAETTRRFFQKPVWADIFVVRRSKNESSSVATSWWPSARTMPPRRGLNFVWIVVLQICRAYGAGDAAEGGDGPVLKFKRRDDAQLLHRPRQVADDEAASGAPEHSLSGNAQTSRSGPISATRPGFPSEHDWLCLSGLPTDC